MDRHCEKHPERSEAQRNEVEGCDEAILLQSNRDCFALLAMTNLTLSNYSAYVLHLAAHLSASALRAWAGCNGLSRYPLQP